MNFQKWQVVDKTCKEMSQIWLKEHAIKTDVRNMLFCRIT